MMRSFFAPFEVTQANRGKVPRLSAINLDLRLFPLLLFDGYNFEFQKPY